MFISQVNWKLKWAKNLNSYNRRIDYFLYITRLYGVKISPKMLYPYKHITLLQRCGNDVAAFVGGCIKVVERLYGGCIKVVTKLF